MVDNDLVNLNFFSIKLATGKKSIAIKKARKNGARILSPNARRYPIPIIEMTTSVSLTRKGNRIKFIILKIYYKNKKNPPN
jgi:hypothetical protein